MKPRVTFPIISYHFGDIVVNGKVVGTWTENTSRAEGYNGRYPGFWEANIILDDNYNTRIILANQEEGKKVMVARVREWIYKNFK